MIRVCMSCCPGLLSSNTPFKGAGGCTGNLHLSQATRMGSCLTTNVDHLAAGCRAFEIIIVQRVTKVRFSHAPFALAITLFARGRVQQAALHVSSLLALQSPTLLGLLNKTMLPSALPHSTPHLLLDRSVTVSPCQDNSHDVYSDQGHMGLDADTRLTTCSRHISPPCPSSCLYKASCLPPGPLVLSLTDRS